MEEKWSDRLVSGLVPWHTQKKKAKIFREINAWSWSLAILSLSLPHSLTWLLRVSVLFSWKTGSCLCTNKIHPCAHRISLFRFLLKGIPSFASSSNPSLSYSLLSCGFHLLQFLALLLPFFFFLSPDLVTRMPAFLFLSKPHESSRSPTFLCG